MTTAAEVKAARKANYAAQKENRRNSRVSSGNPGTSRDEAGLLAIEATLRTFQGLTPAVLQGVAGLLVSFVRVRTGSYRLELWLVPEKETAQRPRIRSIMGEIAAPTERFAELTEWAGGLVSECYIFTPKNVIGNRLLEEPELTGWKVGGPTAKKVAQLAARGLTAVPVGPTDHLTFRLARKGYKEPKQIVKTDGFEGIERLVAAAPDVIEAQLHNNNGDKIILN